MSNQGRKLSFLDIIWMYKGTLAIYIICISFITFALLYAFGGVPQELKVLDETSAQSPAQTETQVKPVSQSQSQITSKNPLKKPASSATQPQGEIPVRIIINKISVDSVITNPESSDNNTLNNYLLKGAVRYPGSGTLGQGNMFIFGHSTGIRIVNNQAYKTFNHIKDLNIDDVIKVESQKKVYTYKVTSISLVDSDAAMVDLDTSKNMLTLSTCDVFGQKQQRFVVEADFVSSAAL